MPIYNVGDLVKLNPGRWSKIERGEGEEVVMIVKMRSLMNTRPEVMILWNDVPEFPLWMIIDEIVVIQTVNSNQGDSHDIPRIQHET